MHFLLGWNVWPPLKLRTDSGIETRVLFIRPHRMHAAWSLCLSVCWLHGCARMFCAKTAEPIDMPFGGWVMCVQGKMSRGRDPHEKGQFWESSGPLKSIGSLCYNVCSKMDHTSLNNDCCSLLQCSRLCSHCHIMLSSVKKLPTLRCGL